LIQVEPHAPHLALPLDAHQPTCGVDSRINIGGTTEGSTERFVRPAPLGDC
jgi:hypothetical protein